MFSKLKKYFIPHKDNDFSPHFFNESTLVTILCISITLFATSLSGNFVVTKTSLLGSVHTSMLIDLANQDRRENNLPTLTINNTLQNAAQMKANDMVANSYFAHTSPSGVTPWDWFKKAGYLFSYAGENLAIDFNDSIDINNAWLASPTHRANIMNSQFTEIGIATAEGLYNGRKTIFVVQMFGRPKIVKQATPVKKIISQPENPKNVSRNNSNQTAQVLGSEIVSQGTPQVVITDDSLIITEENQRFIAVQDVTSEPANISDAPSYTKWYEKLLITQPNFVSRVFTILIIITIIAIALFIGIEIKYQHPRKIIFGFILLFILVALTYFNQGLILNIF